MSPYPAPKEKPSVTPIRKPHFTIRDLPAWPLRHQDWISDGARHLYCALKSMADGRTGRLFIPGRSWITLGQIERKAGICERTRKKYFRELVALGGLAVHRDHVIRHIGGRNRKVFGPAQVTLLQVIPPASQNGFHFSPLKPQSSTIGQVKKAHKQRGSTIGQVCKNPLLPGKSCTVQEMPDQFLSETTIRRSGGAVGSNGNGNKGTGVQQRRQKAPIRKPDDSVQSAFVSLLKRAENTIMQGRDESERPAVRIALDLIKSRETKPQSVGYYLTSYERLSGKDHEVVLWYLENPGSNENRNMVNALLQKAIEVAERERRPAWEVLRELREQDKNN